jgi:hypothetical protein
MRFPFPRVPHFSFSASLLLRSPAFILGMDLFGFPVKNVRTRGGGARDGEASLSIPRRINVRIDGFIWRPGTYRFPAPKDPAKVPAAVLTAPLCGGAAE